MKYNISKIWKDTFELMVKNPLVLLPFIFIGFFESVALELIHFSTRWPLAVIANPIIIKFFGEPFAHYPGNFMILSKVFYYAQITIYIFLSVGLVASSINIFKNIKEGLPIRLKAVFKNVIKRYFEYFLYGCIIIILLSIVNNGGSFLLTKIFLRINRLLPQSMIGVSSIMLMLLLFIGNVIIYTLFAFTIPLMVIEKKRLLASCGLSIYISVRNFFKVLPLVLVPFIIYLPFTLLKSFPAQLSDKLFPEINLLISFASIIVTIFVDCFMIMSVTQWFVKNK